ncbi:nucleotidyltransferase [Taibaiella chishuiensis]|uniref:Nucleotidyltransferase DUF2204 n=1 Tax=Taibaiella chishuiensis TaxID=1434707 RepID=A0A2P8D1A4_9BACT|nr:nucleotidyltransferase [Taibaiella chishuiensis]PSK91003.1 nucleotidyltransferase DUF2204 [Taibaiella chishuiensis]
MNGTEQIHHAAAFYQKVLAILEASDIDFMIGGSFAVFEYTGTFRQTKDMDIYCRPVDYPEILKLFAAHGYETQLTDVRWLAKVFDAEKHFIDIIFDTVNNICKVDDTWFANGRRASVCDMEVTLIGPEELLWGKMYVMNRERYDGADVNHLLLKQGRDLDWRRLSELMEPNWHLLLSNLLLFQFVYPSDYADIIPRPLFDRLIERAKEQYDLPRPVERICRGPLIDQTQYQVDIKEWDYKSYTIKTV